MPVTYEDRRRAICRPRQQLLYHRRIGFNGSIYQPAKHARTPVQERGIAEERSRQEDVLAMLDHDAGNAEVGDRNLIARIAAVRGGAPDSVGCRYNLVPNDRLGLTARDDDQCAR